MIVRVRICQPDGAHLGPIARAAKSLLGSLKYRTAAGDSRVERGGGFRGGIVGGVRPVRQVGEWGLMAVGPRIEQLA